MRILLLTVFLTEPRPRSKVTVLFTICKVNKLIGLIAGLRKREPLLLAVWRKKGGCSFCEVDQFSSLADKRCPSPWEHCRLIIVLIRGS